LKGEELNNVPIENGVKPVRLVDNASTGDAERLPTNANATRGAAVGRI
jgi:hypothetical protein